MGTLLRFRSVWVPLLGLWGLMVPGGGWALAQDDTPVVQVRVDRLILPCQVVDAAGEPVFDLRPEDIRLEVEGKVTPFELLSYRFQAGSGTGAGEMDPVKIRETADRRVVVLLLDPLFSSREGLERAQKTAEAIVTGAAASDRFLVLCTNGATGLVHVAGPSADKNLVLGSIRDLKVTPQVTVPHLFSVVGKDASAEGWFGNDDKRLNDARRREYALAQNRYMDQIAPFAEGLERLQYLLNTWTVPRVVFLFSEGIAEGAFAGRGRRTRLQGLLRGAIQAISRTGTPVHTISTSAPDPYREEMAALDSGVRSLQVMAGEGGGACYAGPAPQDVARRVLRQTSAYYELAFAGAGKDGRRSVQVLPVRKGLRITTLPSVVQRPRFADYNGREKEAMAISLAANPQAMIESGQMERLAVEILEDSESGTGRLVRLGATVPQAYVGKPVDLYTVFLDPKGQGTRVESTPGRVLALRETFSVTYPQDLVPAILLVPQEEKPILALLWKSGEKETDGGFAEFFARFRQDPDYQLAHVVFPFWRYRVEKETGHPELMGTVAREEWEHTTFEEMPDMKWSVPRSDGDRMVLSLTGPHGCLDLVFRQSNGSWMLSESRLRGN